MPFALARGWRVTGLARAADEEFVRGLGADFTGEATTGWDAVADPARAPGKAVALVRDGGLFVGVQSAAVPAERARRRDRRVAVVPDGARLAGLLDAHRGRRAAGPRRRRPARSTEAAEAHRTSPRAASAAARCSAPDDADGAIVVTFVRGELAFRPTRNVTDYPGGA